MLCYVKKKKSSRAVSAFSLENWHPHHSSLRHAQELQNWQPTLRYIFYGLMFLFGSIVSRRREIQHAELLDAKEQNRTKLNRTEQYI